MPATTLPDTARRALRAVTLLAATALAASLASAAQDEPAAGAQQRSASSARDDASKRIVPVPVTRPDRSGRKQVGNGSFYADFFAGRKMANGEPFRLDSNNAASRTLPLGTTARVTNLENGRSAVVVIKDRGPYVAGRIVDVSPSTAEQST